MSLMPHLFTPSPKGAVRTSNIWLFQISLVLAISSLSLPPVTFKISSFLCIFDHNVKREIIPYFCLCGVINVSLLSHLFLSPNFGKLYAITSLNRIPIPLVFNLSSFYPRKTWIFFLSWPHPDTFNIVSILIYCIMDVWNLSTLILSSAGSSH